MPSPTQWKNAQARQRLYTALRSFFAREGYLEVETPCLVPAPGLEPHIDPFEVAFVPQSGVGVRRTLYLHTSPEYAMKRLLAEGSPPLFQICKAFRNGEVSAAHNPEFTLLELYRPNADYRSIMSDLEAALGEVEQAVSPGAELFSRRPFERLTVRDAVLRHAGLDLREHPDGPSLKRAALAKGIFVGESEAFDDVFFHVFLERVERQLGLERPTFLLEYPASMASLSRLKPGDPTVAERVELYAQGVELANGFSELTDEVEQRARLVQEQELRRSQGRPAYALDENFLAAVHELPPSGGIAVGLDRVLMLLVGASDIAEVLLFPGRDFV